MIIAIIGLGKMGSRIAIKLHAEKHQVFAWNRTPKNISGIKSATTLQELVSKLSKPRIFWIMLPAGDPTQTAINELSKYLRKGDIVVDGGNANFKDTEKRFQKFKKTGIEFLGIGVSGGIIAAKNGYPLMVGGSKKAYLKIKPILDSLSKPNGGYQYFGEGGAGHFVKMVHNAIEYGYMQAIGEGFEVLDKSKYKFNLEQVANLYRKNTLISGFMMDRTQEVLDQDPKLKKLTGVIGRASGETIWTIEEAKKMGIKLEIIEASLKYRFRSETDLTIQKSFTARMVSALRNAFGGHEIKKK
jgi:6-phosphogluconate dehydrogenase